MECVIFVGIQASGKTEFYRQNFFKTHVRINMDMLRTRHREDILLNACIEAKQPFVVDNTNPTVSERSKYIAAARRAKFKIVGYYFQTDLDGSLERNVSRVGKEHLERIAILGTHKKLELPGIKEGFDELKYVRIAEGFSFNVEDYNEI
jgi:predicted kinase